MRRVVRILAAAGLVAGGCGERPALNALAERGR